MRILLICIRHLSLVFVVSSRLLRRHPDDRLARIVQSHFALQPRLKRNLVENFPEERFSRRHFHLLRQIDSIPRHVVVIVKERRFQPRLNRRQRLFRRRVVDLHIDEFEQRRNDFALVFFARRPTDRPRLLSLFGRRQLKFKISIDKTRYEHAANRPGNRRQRRAAGHAFQFIAHRIVGRQGLSIAGSTVTFTFRPARI